MSSVSRLLRHLEQNAGQKISRKDLAKFVTQPHRPGKTRSFIRKGKFTSGGNDYDIDVLLAELSLIGLIQFEGSKILPKKPFVVLAKASVSPSGMVFAGVKGAGSAARDLFVSPGYTLNAMTGDEVVVKLRDKSRNRFEGVIVEIKNRARSFYRMKLLSGPVHRGVPGVVLDSSSRITVCLPIGRLPGDMVARLKQDVVVIVRLSGKTVQHMGIPLLEAEFIRFENDTDMDPDYVRVLLKYDLDPVYPELPGPWGADSDEKSDGAAEVYPDSVHDWKARKDLRNLYTVTIDGPDSKDFDDAISLVKDSDRLWKLYVHIADVSHYVEQGSPLDREASRRATSVYLANRVVPMLPPILSENYCSLVAGVNRLAFTAEMDIRPHSGEIVRYDFYKSVIRVDRRLTYEIAEEILEGKEKDSGDLRDVWRMSQAQKKARLDSGRIDLDMREPKIVYHQDGRIKEVIYRQRLKSSMLIEECMLSANICAAALMRKRDAHTLYRIHEPMDEQKLESLNHFLEIYNINVHIKDSDAASINGALIKVQEHVRSLAKKVGAQHSPGSKSNSDGVSLDRIFQIILLRSFMQAKYSPEPLGHYGLGFKDYCHFTSPIRRYPDLVVHRALASIVRKKKQPYNREEVLELGGHTSDQERKAMEAERDISKLKMLRKLEESGTTRFRGFLAGFKPDRIFMELLEPSVEAIVPFVHLTNDSELILPDPFSAYIKKLSRPAFLGEIWDVELEKLDIEDMKLFVKPVWKRSG